MALLVVGPERLPKLARSAGMWLGRGRRFISSVKDDIDREIKADELRQILERMGLSGAALVQGVAEIARRKRKWVDLMLVEEYGLSPVDPHPFRAAQATFLAFLALLKAIDSYALVPPRELGRALFAGAVIAGLCWLVNGRPLTRPSCASTPSTLPALSISGQTSVW